LIAGGVAGVGTAISVAVPVVAGAIFSGAGTQATASTIGLAGVGAIQSLAEQKFVEGQQISPTETLIDAGGNALGGQLGKLPLPGIKAGATSVKDKIISESAISLYTEAGTEGGKLILNNLGIKKLIDNELRNNFIPPKPVTQTKSGGKSSSKSSNSGGKNQPPGCTCGCIMSCLPKK